VQQFPVLIKNHHFASASESRIERQHIFVTQGRGKQQLFQVACKHADGFVVGMLFWPIASFRFPSMAATGVYKHREWFPFTKQTGPIIGFKNVFYRLISRALSAKGSMFDFQKSFVFRP